MRIRTVYNRLLTAYGRQHWWPADSPFEVMVGAVLTQNTAWTNVEKAIANLKQHDVLEAGRLLSLSHDALARHLKPSGYFNIKAKRLRNFCEWYQQAGGYDRLRKLKTLVLRKALLSVNGVGAETADDILLYAFSRKVFVIDAYTRRIFSRIGISDRDVDYETLRSVFENHLKDDSVSMFNEYHALIVVHGKDICKTKPLCERCCLKRSCKQLGV
jgi:endonuclease-3 related protein